MFVEAASSSKSYDPRTAYLQACTEWLPRFNTDCDGLFHLDDVVLLADMYYTPFQVRVLLNYQLVLLVAVE